MRDVHASRASRPAGQPKSGARSVLETTKTRPAGAYIPYIGGEPVVPAEDPKPAAKRARVRKV